MVEYFGWGPQRHIQERLARLFNNGKGVSMAKIDLEAGAACVMHVFFEEEVLVETLVEALRDGGSSSRCPWRCSFYFSYAHILDHILY